MFCITKPIVYTYVNGLLIILLVVKDFDDWDDVGLNISKPPGLLYLFREYNNYAMSDQEQLNRILDLVGGANCRMRVGLATA